LTVQASATLTVGRDQLVAAVLAVAPHAAAAGGRKGDETLARVRFIAADPKRRELYIVATNGGTSAWATVPIDEGGDSRAHRVAEDDGVFVLDAEVSEVRLIPSRFLRGKRGDSIRRTLRLHFTDTTLTVTDVTEYPTQLSLVDEDATVPARELGLVLLGARADYPDVLDSIGNALKVADGEPLVSSALVVDRSVLGLFAHAGQAYGTDLELSPIAGGVRGWLVRVGAWFVGTVPSNDSTDSLGRRKRAAAMHLARATGDVVEFSPDDLLPSDRVPDDVEHGRDDDGAPGEDEEGFYDPDRDPNALSLDDELEAAGEQDGEGDRG